MHPIYILGKPVGHSRSPVFQNAALRASGLPPVYTAKEVEVHEMGAIADAVRRGEVLGCNITLPHKEEAARLADVRMPAVEGTGVANTWWEADGKLHADNTDVYGLQMSFAALLGTRIARKVVVLGAGGAAQAALYALAPFATELLIVNRTLSKADAAVKNSRFWFTRETQLDAAVWPSTAAEAHEVNAALRDADLVIQTSSIPILYPGDASSFAALDLESVGANGGALLELCYANEPTVPMQRAAAGGAKVLDGATMLLHQGARSFERWVGTRPNIEVMRDALADALGRPKNEIAAELSDEVRRAWGEPEQRQAACNRV